MRSLTLTILALAAPAFVFAAAPADVLNLGGIDDIAAAAKDFKLLAVSFFAPWCEPCVAFDKEWVKAAAELKRRSSDARLARVDATTELGLPLNQRFNVSGYPTVLMFKGGDIASPIAYSHPEQVKGPTIARHMDRRAKPLVAKLDSEVDVKKFMSDADPVAVVAFVPAADSAALAALEQAAHAHLDDMNCGYVTDRSFLEACPEGKECTSPLALMRKKSEAIKQRYEGDFVAESLVEWAGSRAAPLVAKYVGVKKRSEAHSVNRDFDRAWRVGLPKVVVALEKAADYTTEVQKLVADAAKANVGLKFFVVTHEEGKGKLTSFGIAVAAMTSFPAFFIEGVNGLKYWSTGVRLDTLPTFINDFRAGSLDPYARSEDPATVMQSGPVLAVTGKTYNEMVMRSGKATFLNVYVPGGRRLKTMEAAWEATAKALKGRSDVAVAQLNAERNDVPDARVEFEKIPTYPVLWWIPADPKGRAVEYKGERTEKDLMAFVEAKLKPAAGGHEEL